MRQNIIYSYKFRFILLFTILQFKRCSIYFYIFQISETEQSGGTLNKDNSAAGHKVGR